MEPIRMVDVATVAKMLGVSARHISRLSDSGRMPRPVHLGNAVRWDRVAIQDWIAGGCQPLSGAAWEQSTDASAVKIAQPSNGESLLEDSLPIDLPTESCQSVLVHTNRKQFDE